MATADLGVRIILDDLAGSGINSLNLNMLGLGGTINWLIGLWSQLNPVQQGAAAVVAGAAVDYKLFSDALNEVIAASGDLQQSMTQVDIAVQGASERAADMQATLTNLADYSIFSSQKVADGFTMLGERSFNAAQILDDGLGKAMVDLAESIQSDTVPAADLLGSSLNAFHLKASDAQQVASELTAAFYNGIPSVSGLQQAIAQAGSTAYTSGMSFSDFLTVLDTLVKDGIPASQAATSLRYMLQALQDPTAKAADEMANLGIITVKDTAPGLQSVLAQTNALNKTPLQLTGTLSDLQALYTAAKKVGALHTDESFYQWALSIGAISNTLYDANGNFTGMSGILSILGPKLANLKTPQDFQVAMEQLFNVRGGKGAQTLLADLGQTETGFDNTSKAITDAAKSNLAFKDAQQIVSNYNAVVKELGSTWHSTAAQIGGPVIGALTPLLSWLNNTLNAVRTQHPDWLQFIGVFLMVGKVLSGVALAAGALFLVMTVLDGALLPVIAIVLGVAAGIALLSLGIAFLVTHWKQIETAIHPVIAAFQSFIGGVGKFLGPMFKEQGKEIGGFAGTIRTAVAPVIQSILIPAIHNLGNAFKIVAPSIQFAIKLTGMLLSTAIPSLGIIVGIVFGIIVGVIHGFIVFFAGVVSIFVGLVGIISGVLQIILGVFHLIFGLIHDIVTGNFKQIPKTVMDSLSMMGTGILDIIKGIAAVLLGIFTAVFGSIAAVVGGAISGIIGFFTHMGAAIMAPLDAIINKIAQFLGAIQKIPGVGSVVHAAAGFLRIPGLAEGGVVTGPTLAVVGEGREPEVVLPVSKLAAFMGNYKGAGQGGNGGTTVVNNILDGRVISQSVINHVTGEIKAMGASRMFR